MVILILGKTIIFWSGILAAISLFIMLFTCHFISKLLNLANEKRAKIHKYFVIITIISALVHITLALLSSLFNIWI